MPNNLENPFIFCIFVLKMDEVMYKTDIEVLISSLTPTQKDRMLKDIILSFRKEGNNYVLGSKIRESLRKNLPHSDE
tara:strand:- start:355 stop:585 length:231 start_codon:yes stop_codon:yes gene_type:complete